VSSKKRLLPRRESRGFQITVHPDGDAYGITLNEINGKTTPVASINRRRMRDLDTFVTQAAKDSGHSRTALHAGLKGPILLLEEVGVRLALGLFATEGVRKGRRKHTMLTGVQDMAAEEAYYWYAKCVGNEGARVRRALRLFLAEE
jgi:hypothetical protein